MGAYLKKYRMPIDIYVKLRKGELNVEDCHNNSILDSAITYQEIIWKNNRSHPNGDITSYIERFPIYHLWGMNEKADNLFDDIWTKSRGSNIFWIMFGYSGTGKTFTMNQLLEKVLLYANTISAYQIDGNQIFDVFNKNKQICFLKTEQLELEHLKCIQITDLNSNDIIEQIKKIRTTRRTLVNNTSSRTHLIIRIQIDNKTLTIADLAGQEAGKTNHKNSKEICKQAIHINKSMLALKECIRAYQNKAHIPYRRSIITMALKHIFLSNSYTSIIGTVNPEMRQETLDTIKYISPLFKYVKNKNRNKYKAETNYVLKMYNRYRLESQKNMVEIESIADFCVVIRKNLKLARMYYDLLCR